MEILANFLQPQIEGDPVTVSEQISFTLAVNSCLVETFTAEETLPNIDYTLGESTVTYGPYSFKQSPDCGYSTIISDQNLPKDTYVTHDKTNGQLTILKSDKYEFVGTYDSTIKSVFLQPEIDGSSKPVEAQFSFKINVALCTVNTFEVVSNPIGTVIYTLGEEGISFGYFEFQQTPNCNFEQTFEYENLPEPLVKLNPENQSFLINKNLEQKWLKTYNIVIRSEFNQPTAIGESVKVKQTKEFVLEVEPCTVTEFSSDSAIGTITYTLGEASFKFGAYAFTQSPFCGYDQ